jgi:hypothetical protein
MGQLDEIDRAVLRKLFARRVIGSHHLRLSTLINCGWKSHERGKVKTSIEKLISMGYIVWVKKSKQAIALNKERINEVLAQVF